MGKLGYLLACVLLCIKTEVSDSSVLLQKEQNTPISENIQCAETNEISAEERDFFTDYFQDNDGGMFLHCEFDRPQDADLSTVFYGAQTEEWDEKDLEDAEFDWGFISLCEVNEKLDAFLGLTNEQMTTPLFVKNVDGEDVVAWFAYDCLHSNPVCLGGYKEGGIYTLQMDGPRSVVTLRRNEDDTISLISSHWGSGEDYILSAEKASVIISQAFAAMDRILIPKEENYQPEKSQDVFQYYTLGKYSTEESLKAYLSEWYSEEVFDYVVYIYSIATAFYRDENGDFGMCLEGTPYTSWHEIDYSKTMEIVYADEKECLVKVYFINDKVFHSDPPELSEGEFRLRKEGDRWIIADMSQSHYDSLRDEWERDCKERMNEEEDS